MEAEEVEPALAALFTERVREGGLAGFQFQPQPREPLLGKLVTAPDDLPIPMQHD